MISRGYKYHFNFALGTLFKRSSLLLFFIFPEMSKYIPEGGLDPLTFQNVMDAANIKYYLAKVRLSGNGTYLPA